MLQALESTLFQSISIYFYCFVLTSGLSAGLPKIKNKLLVQRVSQMRKQTHRKQVGWNRDEQGSLVVV